MSDYCDHHWIRDDQNTKQCLHCKSYAPIRDGDFA